MARKTVRFYDLNYVPQSNLDILAPVTGNFWADMGGRVAALAPENRTRGVRGCLLYGEYRTAVQPAISYFYVGRLRPRSEWPDAMDSTGVIDHLKIEDEKARLVDPTFVVPFGASNQVAVFSMSGNSPRVSMLESWFTAITEKNAVVDHYSLTPVLNRKVQRRLAEASGATLFRVKIGPDKEIPVQGGGGIFRAARNAREVSSETTVELGWSLEQRKGTAGTTGTLLEAARFVREDFVDKAKVSLQLPDGERLRRKQYDLIKQQFTSTQRFEMVANQPASEESVLTGIMGAIDDFRAEFS